MRKVSTFHCPYNMKCQDGGPCAYFTLTGRADEEYKVKQLVESNRLTDIAGDITLNFTDGSTIKRMQVSETIHRAVTKGRLAVARYLDGYALIAMPVAEKLMQRDDGVVVYFAQVDENDEVTTTSEEDDWYADSEIPDDLMW